MNREPKDSETRTVKSLRQERYEMPYPQMPEIQQSQKQMQDSNRLLGWVVIGLGIAATVGVLWLGFWVFAALVFVVT